MSGRPSKKETINKLREAEQLIKSGSSNRRVVKPVQFQSQLRSLDLTPKEMWDVVLEIISEINPVDHYEGARPPQKSYESDIAGLELWAYAWVSAKFNNEEMYLKFALQEDVVWIVSFHYSKDKEKF
ncbi:MAG: hypothetical protein NDI63_05785 [Pseudobdellovibrio sp.]|nr:hypothetical protein [Pseudobdellovibrio sp.]